MTPELPEILTEEEAERKVSMMKAASEVADAVDELKKNLEEKGWSLAEQAALTLFNTMLMTSFGEMMKSQQKDAKKKFEDVRERIQQRVVELTIKAGFLRDEHDRQSIDVLKSCVELIMDGHEERAGAVWDSYFGQNTRGVLFSIAVKARDEVAAEIEDEA